MGTRRAALKPDLRGDFRPYIGYRKDGKQQRFNLGQNRDEAERRRDRIQRLYAESILVRENYGQGPSWTEAALHAARLIAAGHSQATVPSPHVVNEASGDRWDIGQYDPEWTDLDPWALVWSHAVCTRHYPSVHWTLPTEGARAAIDFGQAVYDVQARRQSHLLGAQPPENPVAGTFHEALDAYDEYIETTVSKHVTPQTKHQRRDQVKYLKQAHEDVPLAFLDLAGCRTLFGYWTSRPARPEKDDGARYAASTCKHRVSELSMFFDWLHTTETFTWRKPADFDTISKSIAKDRKKRSIKDLIAKKTFSGEELATINRYCGTLERALLYLGLNCSFGAAESGRLEPHDLFLHQPNPIEHVWRHHGFTSEPTESWIAYLRPKTDVAGCWWLFPETVQALEKWMQERPTTTESRLIVSKRGASFYRDDSKNAQSSFQNVWTKLLNRVQEKNPKIPVLPFGTLRDQFSDWAVYRGESEAGSIALAHGTPFKDDLLACYANLPFPRLFNLQKEFRNELALVFESAP